MMSIVSWRTALFASVAVSIVSVGAAALPAMSAPVAADAGPGGASAAQPSTSRSVSFVAAAHSSPGSARFTSVTVPAAAHAGDRALLMVTHATRVPWAGPSGIAGWQQVASTSTNGLDSSVYAKTLAFGDLGGSVRFDAPAYAKAMLTVAVYSRVSSRASLTAVVGSDRGTTRHVTPSVTASTGDRVISYWVDHQSSTTSWTTSDETTRDTAIGTGAAGTGRCWPTPRSPGRGASYRAAPPAPTSPPTRPVGR